MTPTVLRHANMSPSAFRLLPGIRISSSLRAADSPHQGFSSWCRLFRPDTCSPQTTRFSTTSSRPTARRPENVRQPMFVTDARWQKVSEKRRNALSHVGKITETSLGVDAATPCQLCAREGKRCQVYALETRHWQWGAACSRCRMRGSPCSHTSLADQKQPTRLVLRAASPAVERSASEALAKQNKQLKAEIQALQRLNKALRDTIAHSTHSANSLGRGG